MFGPSSARKSTEESTTRLDQLETRLRRTLHEFESVLVAFSGGVDSSYLLDVSHEVLGSRALGVTADSPSLARTELERARSFCRQRGIAHHVLRTGELDDPEYVRNDGQRCYVCKATLFDAMCLEARRRATASGKQPTLLLGAIVDDLSDHRPGMRAAAERGAVWPLAQLGFSKSDVRELSRRRGLDGWERPAQPCLSSRMPYGEPVLAEGLRMVERAEELLRKQGFSTCRARHHRVGDGGGFLCRLEVSSSELTRAVEQRARLVSELKAIGYRFVALDLEGHRSGSLNVLLQ